MNTKKLTGFFNQESHGSLKPMTVNLDNIAFVVSLNIGDKSYSQIYFVNGSYLYVAETQDEIFQ